MIGGPLVVDGLSGVMCSIDWGLVTNAFAAFGSIGAAVAALYIATADRRERQRERDAAAEAQAKLVIVKIGFPSDYRNAKAPEYPVQCENHSSLPILDVRLESAKMLGFPRAKPKLSEFVSRLIGVDDNASFNTSWVNENEDPFPHAQKQQHINAVDIEATVSFFDACGNHWLRTNTGTTKLVKNGGDGRG